MVQPVANETNDGNSNLEYKSFNNSNFEETTSNNIKSRTTTTSNSKFRLSTIHNKLMNFIESRLSEKNAGILADTTNSLEKLEKLERSELFKKLINLDGNNGKELKFIPKVVEARTNLSQLDDQAVESKSDILNLAVPKIENSRSLMETQPKTNRNSNLHFLNVQVKVEKPEKDNTLNETKSNIDITKSFDETSKEETPSNDDNSTKDYSIEKIKVGNYDYDKIQEIKTVAGGEYQKVNNEEQNNIPTNENISKCFNVKGVLFNNHPEFQIDVLNFMNKTNDPKTEEKKSTNNKQIDLFNPFLGGVDFKIISDLETELERTKTTLNYANKYIESLRTLSEIDRQNFNKHIINLETSHEEHLKSLILQFMEFLYSVKFNFNCKTRNVIQNCEKLEASLKKKEEQYNQKVKELKNEKDQRNTITAKNVLLVQQYENLQEKFMKVLQSNVKIKDDMEIAKIEFGTFVKENRSFLEEYNEQVLKKVLEYSARMSKAQSELTGSRKDLENNKANNMQLVVRSDIKKSSNSNKIATNKKVIVPQKPPKGSSTTKSLPPNKQTKNSSFKSTNEVKNNSTKGVNKSPNKINMPTSFVPNKNCQNTSSLTINSRQLNTRLFPQKTFKKVTNSSFNYVKKPASILNNKATTILTVTKTPNTPCSNRATGKNNGKCIIKHKKGN